MEMSEAIEIADQCNVGLVSVRNSNHSSLDAYYIQLEAEANKISIVTSNATPLVVPHGGMLPVLGTNPFSFGAPVRGGQSILTNFSTSAISGSMIRKAITDSEQNTLRIGTR